MAKDRDDELNMGMPGPEEELSAEEILDEYRAATSPKILNFPDASEPEAPGENPPENLLNFPAAEESPLAAGIGMLKRKSEEYAQHMFEEEGVEDDEEVKRAEKYVPGVDAEDEDAPLRQRRPRRVIPTAPDLPPQELYRRYNRGLSFLRFRAILVFLLALPLLYVTLAGFFRVPLPGLLGSSYPLRVYTLAGMLAAAMVLGIDVLLAGFFEVLHFGIGMGTLISLSCVATLTDALTMLRLDPREEALPYCAISALALGLAMWGTYLKRRGQRGACRTAASAKEPYLVTLDQGKWNGRAAYAKHSGEPAGFGSQIQAPDGAQRMFRVVAPLLLMACLLLSLIASLGQRRPERILWCLSATLTAAGSFSGLLCFSIPWNSLSRRLSQSGAALAGWDGIAHTRDAAGILITDTDLFPPGAVTLNGIKVFGDFPVERVVGYTATLLRQAGGGLDRLFHEILRTQGAIYRNCSEFSQYEGGMGARIRDNQVLVGSAAFMHLMEVGLPQGLNVKNAVFCAIDGDLAGIFALNYALGTSVSPALLALTRNHVGPVLATRDFNIIPGMLRQRYKLPVEKMEYPAAPRRCDLSAPEQEHSDILTAVLCREGLGPFSEAVVGAQRLRFAVRISAFLACIGSLLGVLLSFYLTFVGSYSSLSPANLLIFMLMWLVPTALISGWVNRY
ncbi:MAG: hypothetical protein RR211_03695 [Pseudoflavonifractor sp.]